MTSLILMCYVEISPNSVRYILEVELVYTCYIRMDFCDILQAFWHSEKEMAVR